MKTCLENATRRSGTLQRWHHFPRSSCRPLRLLRESCREVGLLGKPTWRKGCRDRRSDVRQNVAGCVGSRAQVWANVVLQSRAENLSASRQQRVLSFCSYQISTLTAVRAGSLRLQPSHHDGDLINVWVHVRPNHRGFLWLFLLVLVEN